MDVKLRRPVTHEWIDQRSLALHTEIAEMIRANPELLNRAKGNLTRWMQGNGSSFALVEWAGILKTSSLNEILDLLTRDDEDTRRLRQSSPFCGILPEERRLAIFHEYEKRLWEGSTHGDLRQDSIVKNKTLAEDRVYFWQMPWV